MRLRWPASTASAINTPGAGVNEKEKKKIGKKLNIKIGTKSFRVPKKAIWNESKPSLIAAVSWQHFDFF